MQASILVGDIGGTNARLAIAEKSENGIDIKNINIRSCNDYNGLEAAIEDCNFILPKYAVFALAAPNNAQEMHFTHNDWVVSRAKIKAHFGFEDVVLINDFAAQAMAVPYTDKDKLLNIKHGNVMPDSPIVVLGPGTGLGLSTLVPISGKWHVLPSQGGHQAFAPKNLIEREILAYLAKNDEPITFENLVSGSGLALIYKTLGKIKGVEASLETPAQIGDAAIKSEDSIAIEAAQILSLMLATFCSNAVLSKGAMGGCVICGGVAQKLSKFIQMPEFTSRFLNVGAMQDYLKDVPISQNLDPMAALRGAAAFI